MEELFYNKYLKQAILGRGASSEVWRVIDREAGVIQAIKIYNPVVAIENDGIEMLKHEFALMANINHQNLLRPLFFGINGNSPFLVLPYCKNGNLKKKVGQFTDKDAWTLLRDVASGLAYLHKQVPPIIHQDIKPENILIGDDGSYLLTDFGISAHASATMRGTISSTLTSAGTVAYMPPEKFGKEKSLITLSDIWSLGAMTYELLTGEVPFSIGTMEGGALQMNGAEIPYLPEDIDPVLADTVYKCLSKEPWNRPKAAELEWFADQMLQGKDVTPPWENRKKKTQPPSLKPKRWTIITASGIALACIFILLAIIWFPDPPTPVKEDDIVLTLSVEDQYEQAYQMLKDKKQARDGLNLLKQLSENKHYEKATFLWSRLLFQSDEEKDRKAQNQDWPYMRNNASLSIDNKKAHDLLELAVEQDSMKTNDESRCELAMDYIYNESRDPSYSTFRGQIPFLQKAINLLKEAIVIASANGQSATIRDCQDKIADAEKRIKQLEKGNQKKK